MNDYTAQYKAKQAQVKAALIKAGHCEEVASMLIQNDIEFVYDTVEELVEQLEQELTYMREMLNEF